MSLHVQDFPAHTTASVEPIVLLHGWGFSGTSMMPLVEPLRALADVWLVDLPGFGRSQASADFTPEVVTAALAQTLPPRAVLLGWSLGGVLAQAYAQIYPARVSALITLASNACFVQRPEWPAAMPSEVNRQFNADFARTPRATANIFCALVAQGGERSLLKTLRAQMTPPPNPECWVRALAYLAASDNRAAWEETRQPSLHLFAQRDALVPVAAAEAVAALNPAQPVRIIANACHALHWQFPGQVSDAIIQFLQTQLIQQLDKTQVARSFSRAAASYDGQARLQRKVGQKLLRQVAQHQTTEAKRVLDVGAGTGFISRALRQQTGAEELIALDVAEGMLAYARGRHPHADAWLCGDAEALPLASASVDVIFTSLAIQWCENLPQLFAEFARVLRPGGQLHIATLGPGTLAELASAWQAVDDYVHVNRFYPLATLTQNAAAAGLPVVCKTTESEVFFSANVFALSRELKDLGAHNINRGRAQGLTGRRQLSALAHAYEPYRTERGLPMSYQVAYLAARKQEMP